MDRINAGELPVPPREQASPDESSESLFSFSPGISMINRMQKSGKTFTEVYADYVKLQDEYAKKCAEYDHMDRTLAAVLAQIEERVCTA